MSAIVSLPTSSARFVPAPFCRIEKKPEPATKSEKDLFYASLSRLFARNATAGFLLLLAGLLAGCRGDKPSRSEAKLPAFSEFVPISHK